MHKVIVGLIASLATSVVSAENGFTGEVLMGSAEQRLTLGSTTGASGNDTAFGLRGTYLFSPHIGLELSYINYGQATDSYLDADGATIEDRLRTSATGLGLVGKLQLADRLHLVGRLGLASWQFELQETDSAFPSDVYLLNDKGVDFYSGVGLQIELNEHAFIGVEYNALRMDVVLADTYADQKIETIAASIGYKF